MAHSGTILYMHTDPDNPDIRVLTAPLPCPMEDRPDHTIGAGFTWDGASTPLLLLPLFPKWNHPISTCRHDHRCREARNAHDREWADKQFEKDVGTTGWWITKKIGYIGVRVGAFFGVGSNFERD